MSQPGAWVEKGTENEYTTVFSTAYLRIFKELDLTGKEHFVLSESMNVACSSEEICYRQFRSLFSIIIMELWSGRNNHKI